MPAQRTVYLDLNHWYALGEAMAGHPRQAGDADVLRMLAKLVNQGQLAFPLSAVHYMELAENPRDHQREEAAKVMAVLSHFRTMAPISKILDEELALALNRRFGRPAFPVKVRKFGVGVGFAFGEEKHFRLTGGSDEDRRKLQFQLGRSIAEWEAEVNTVGEYFMLYGPSGQLRGQVPNYDPYAARRVADDELKSFNVMVQTLRTDPDIASRPLDAICARQFVFEFLDKYTLALISAGFFQNRTAFRSKEEYTGFLMDLPSRKVTAMIQHHYLKDVKRNWTINDLRDIAALAIAIPYCDIVVTDKKAWDVSANRARLGKEFSTAIFSRLSDLAAHLST